MTNTGEHNQRDAISSRSGLFPGQEEIWVTAFPEQLRSCPVLKSKVSITELLSARAQFHVTGLQDIYNFEQLFEKGT